MHSADYVHRYLRTHGCNLFVSVRKHVSQCLACVVLMYKSESEGNMANLPSGAYENTEICACDESNYYRDTLVAVANYLTKNDIDTSCGLRKTVLEALALRGINKDKEGSNV